MNMQGGGSLVESLTVLGILSVLAVLAIPSLSVYQESRRVEGIALELAADVHNARTEAVAKNRPVRLRFQADAGGTCYLLHTGDSDACSCSSDGASQCAAASDIVIKSAGLPLGRGVTINSNASSMLFHMTRGTVSPTGSVNVTGNRGRQLRLVVNILGRARACSPDASMPGYQAC